MAIPTSGAVALIIHSVDLLGNGPKKRVSLTSESLTRRVHNMQSLEPLSKHQNLGAIIDGDVTSLSLRDIYLFRMGTTLFI